MASGWWRSPIPIRVRAVGWWGRDEAANRPIANHGAAAGAVVGSGPYPGHPRVASATNAGGTTPFAPRGSTAPREGALMYHRLLCLLADQALAPLHGEVRPPGLRQLQGASLAAEPGGGSFCRGLVPPPRAEDDMSADQVMNDYERRPMLAKAVQVDADNLNELAAAYDRTHALQHRRSAAGHRRTAAAPGRLAGAVPGR